MKDEMYTLNKCCIFSQGNVDGYIELNLLNQKRVFLLSENYFLFLVNIKKPTSIKSLEKKIRILMNTSSLDARAEIIKLIQCNILVTRNTLPNELWTRYNWLNAFHFHLATRNQEYADQKLSNSEEKNYKIQLSKNMKQQMQHQFF